MATYIIETPYHTRIMKRRDAACDAFMLAVYDALGADGQLDTKAGHKINNACLQMATDVRSNAYGLFSYSVQLPHNLGLIKFERTS